MSRIVESPRIKEDSERLATNWIIKLGEMRTEGMRRIDQMHVNEDKRLLREAVHYLDALHIFPTVEIVGQIAGGQNQTHQEKLLFVRSRKMPNKGYFKDFYLNPEGELVAYLRIGEQTETDAAVSDYEYVKNTKAALLAAEKLIMDAREVDKKPKLRVL